MTTLAYPADQLAAAYAWRWPGSETSLKEAKSAIAGAGPSAGPIFRSQSPALIGQEHAAWICATELCRALARSAARRAAPAGKGRRAGQQVQPREISFTAARRAALASTRSGAATASLPAPITVVLHHETLCALGKCRIVIDRHRHRDRKTKICQAFPAAGRAITTRTAPARVTVCMQRLRPRPPAENQSRTGLAIHPRLRRALDQQRLRAGHQRTQTPPGRLRILAFPGHSRPLLPRPLLTGHQPQPRHPAHRRHPQRPHRTPLATGPSQRLTPPREWTPIRPTSPIRPARFLRSDPSGMK